MLQRQEQNTREVFGYKLDGQMVLAVSIPSTGANLEEMRKTHRNFPHWIKYIDSMMESSDECILGLIVSAEWREFYGSGDDARIYRHDEKSHTLKQHLLPEYMIFKKHNRINHTHRQHYLYLETTLDAAKECDEDNPSSIAETAIAKTLIDTEWFEKVAALYVASSFLTHIKLREELTKPDRFAAIKDELELAYYGKSWFLVHKKLKHPLQ